MNKNTLLKNTINDAPELGYVKAKLTIGYWSPAFAEHYGYYRVENVGNLVPNTVNGISVERITTVSGNIYSTVPFYFEGKKYTNGSYDSFLGNTFRERVNQTVDVWLGGGEVFILARIISLLWRTA